MMMSNLNDINQYILEQVKNGQMNKDMAFQILKELNARREMAKNDIAIIGIACRVPGANTVDEYWENLKNGVQSVGKLPASRRKDIEIFLPEAVKSADVDPFMQAGYLDEIDQFDAPFFRLSPREAQMMDPYQRIMLEATWTALEDAGLAGAKLANTQTGVFVGRDHSIESDYKKLIVEPEPLRVSGNWTGILARRISYILNLRGPSIVVDTACSSGLVAIHQACQSLRTKECDLAIAGGINILTLPFKVSGMNMIESPEGVARPFDKKANGNVWAEGVGVVILKPLAKAMEDGDSIYAVIKGSAVNNDGASNGITAPSVEAQEDVIVRAWKDANIQPETISYVEAHATGSAFSDPVEIRGMINAFRKFTKRTNFCAVGSVKGSIGHPVAAAGLAELIKVIMAMKNEQIPPTVNYCEPNPYMNLHDAPVYIVEHLQEWKKGPEPRRAGISAFGFSGTNCHVVVEEAPAINTVPTSLPYEVLTLSAKSKDALKTLVTRYVEMMERSCSGQGSAQQELMVQGGLGQGSARQKALLRESVLELANLCFTANAGRGQYSHRLAIVCQSVEELFAKLTMLKNADWANFSLNEAQGIYYGEHRLVSETKRTQEAGELTEGMRLKLSKTAGVKLQDLIANKVADRQLLAEVCQLYVTGAELNWEELYHGLNRRKVNLPVYPFERKRVWYESPGTRYIADSITTSSANATIATPHGLTMGEQAAVMIEPVQVSLRGRELEGYREIEEHLAQIWGNVLGLAEINVYENFYELGGDSILATKIVNLIKRELRKQVNVRDLFYYTTIDDLARYLEAQTEEPDEIGGLLSGNDGMLSGKAGMQSEADGVLSRTAGMQSEVDGVLSGTAGLPGQVGREQSETAGLQHRQDMPRQYPLSSAQKRLFILRQIEGESTVYNLPGAMLIEGLLDYQRFDQVFNQLVQRHEVFRSSFAMVDDEPVQIVHPEVQFAVEFTEAPADAHPQVLIREFIQPFDLAQAPLLRVRLVKLAVERHLFIFDMHHIISDGTSMGVLKEEFIQLYYGQNLPRQTVQYKDYAEWEAQYFASARFKEEEAFWLKTFEGTVPVLDFPLDFNRPPVQTFEGAKAHAIIGPELNSGLRTLAKRQNASLFHVLTAAYNITLSKYANQDDIVLGTLLAGRQSADWERVIGMFIKTLPLRCQPRADKTFVDFLQEVKEHALVALLHQNYPYELLVEKVVKEKDLSRNPLYSTMLIFHNEVPARSLPQGIQGLSFTELEIDMGISTLDFKLDVMEMGDRLNFTLEYNTRLFKQATMEGFLGHLTKVLEEIIAQPENRLADIDILTEADRQRLAEFNQTTAEIPTRTVYELLEEFAATEPDRPALAFSGREWTYAELNAGANRIARRLQKAGLQSEELVAVILERSEQIILSILGIWKAGGAYIPIEPDYPVQRVETILADSETKAVITERASAHLVAGFSGQVIYLDQDSAEILAESEENLHLPFDIHNLAYVIYTSGSTGKPKGAMVEHIGMINNMLAKIHDAEITAESVIAQNASVCFDISVWQMFIAYLVGAKTVVYAKEQILEPKQFFKAVKEDRISVLEVVPSFLSMLLDELDTLPPTETDLPLVRYLFVTGEAVKPVLVKRWFERYPEIRMINAYGPTEASDDITHYVMAGVPEFGINSIPIGYPLRNFTIYIVDDAMRVCPIGVKGEICVSGLGVGRGYLNNPEKTAAAFAEDHFTTEKGVRLYKTGDLGRFLPDGTIEFFGRKDYQVKIRGFRIELGEIETVLTNHRAIKDAVVVDREDAGGNKYLAGYIVADREMPIAEVRDFLLERLPDYMVPVAFMQLDKLPLNANGKIDRKALPEPEANLLSAREFVAPGNELETRLVEIWAQVLNKERIGVLDNFFELGGQSLLATKLISIVNKEYQISIPLRELFQAATVRDLAGVVERYQQVNAQKASAGVEGPFVRPFELGKAPLLRVSMVELPDQRHLFFLDVHHIIFDGACTDIFVDEFGKLYTGKSLPALPLQYRDFAAWQQEFFQSDRYRKQGEYWLTLFKDGVPRLELPLDYPRPAVRSGKGKIARLPLTKDLAERLKMLAADEGVTIYMLLLAAFNLFLAKTANQPEIVVGTPVSGRTYANLDSIIGMFVNMVAMKNEPTPNLTIRQFLLKVKDRTLESLDNQDYQFEMLVEKLNLAGDVSRNPLFDVMFTLNNLNGSDEALAIEGLRISPYLAEVDASQFDLTLSARQTEDELALFFQYDTALFKPETVEQMSVHLVNILAQMALNMTVCIGDLDMQRMYDSEALRVSGTSFSMPEDYWLDEYENAGSEAISAADWAKIRDEWNNNPQAYPEDYVVHRFFEEQVERTPEGIAVSTDAGDLTYRQVNVRANQLARRLREMGLQTEDFVVLLIERSAEMIIGIIGSMKAGAAQVPLDIASPLERNNFILADTKAKWLLTLTKHTDLIPPDYHGQVVYLDQLGEPDAFDAVNPVGLVGPANAAYLIYTSGSTGQPKGALVEHRALVNRLVDLQANLPLVPGDTVLQRANFAFDGAMVETLGWFMGGARVYMLEPGAEKDMQKIIEVMAREKVSATIFVPTMLNMFLRLLKEEDVAKLTSMKWLHVGGEQLPRDIVEEIKRLPLNMQLVNFYGPAETTIFVTWYNCSKMPVELDRVPIGRVAANSKIYILDQNLQPVPVGRVGEIYIGGVGVTRGYWNRPELTAERFIPDPFSPGNQMYKSGDLGKYLPDGNLLYLGRVDQQVKIRGFRIETGEIEEVLATYPGVTGVAVVARVDKHSTKNLVAYYLGDENIKAAALRDHILRRLPNYMAPAYYVRMTEFPQTASGKVDRKALPEPDWSIRIGARYVAPRTSIEEQLAAVFAEVLRVSRVGINDNFFEMGGDSLRVNHAVVKINNLCQTELTIKDLFNAPTIKDLAPLVEASSRTGRAPIQPVAKNEYYPASSAQKRLYILNQLNETDLSYNLTSTMILEGLIEPKQVEAALKEMITRHESFRTGFAVVDGEIVQKVYEEVDFAVDCYRTESSDIQKILQGEVPLTKAGGAPQNPFKFEKRDRRTRGR